MRYYYCVNCGHIDDVGQARSRRFRCRRCSYDELTELDRGEYIEYARVKELRSDFLNDSEYLEDRSQEDGKVLKFEIGSTDE